MGGFSKTLPSSDTGVIQRPSNGSTKDTHKRSQLVGVSARLCYKKQVLQPTAQTMTREAELVIHNSTSVLWAPSYIPSGPNEDVSRQAAATTSATESTDDKLAPLSYGDFDGKVGLKVDTDAPSSKDASLANDSRVDTKDHGYYTSEQTRVQTADITAQKDSKTAVFTAQPNGKMLAESDATQTKTVETTSKAKEKPWPSWDTAGSLTPNTTALPGNDPPRPDNTPLSPPPHTPLTPLPTTPTHTTPSDKLEIKNDFISKFEGERTTEETGKYATFDPTQYIEYRPGFQALEDRTSAEALVIGTYHPLPQRCLPLSDLSWLDRKPQERDSLYGKPDIKIFSYLAGD